MTPSDTEPAIFRLAAQYLNELRHQLPLTVPYVHLLQIYQSYFVSQLFVSYFIQ
jgi:hypothetical protein